MKSFLEQAAESLWQTYGEEISTLKLVFPSKRARLFFGEALSKLIERPLWQPEYLSIDDFVWQLSTLRQTDKLRLVAELYKIYSRYHNETFDKFYDWGMMLLQDFDTIDKYMVDARSLFRNISDLKEIDAQFADDSPELEIVREFWRNFASGKVHSIEQQEFLRIWTSLADIYTEFKTRLAKLSAAYPGMAYRTVAENIEELYTQSHTYCFLGFNALNSCEHKLFKHLQEKGDAIFLWDYSTLYIDELQQEAGRFIRRNIKHFPQSIALNIEYNRNLDVEVIASPTDILQCKSLTTKLEEIYRRQGYVDKETAVVLTDENLLQVVLTSIPECVSQVNITMGYPVTNSVVYNLLERILQLQIRRIGNEFYHRDVVGLLSHPYVCEHHPQQTKKLSDAIVSQQKIYIHENELSEFSTIFSPQDGLNELQSYLLRVLTSISATDDLTRREFTYSLIEAIAKLQTTISNCTIELNTHIYISLLRNVLRQLRIPYTGEPLGGLQILGILETRNVDFRNVIMLSVSDDNFPGNRAASSYIPFNLRQAYNLPTATDAEAMYAYYFYRLIQRADHLTMLYTSAADDKSTGEQSRYIYQLEYESPFKVRRTEVKLEIGRPMTRDIVVQKDAMMVDKLRKKRFAPSSLSRYIHCPMQFYFRDVERILTLESVDEEFSKLELGNVLHYTLEEIYKPLINKPNPQQVIKKISQGQISLVIDHFLNEVSHQRKQTQSGNLRIVQDVLVRYVNRILTYDAHRKDLFVVDRLEHKISVPLHGVTISGTTDRVDRLEDGSLAIVDYKSGKGDKLNMDSIERLFDTDKTNKAAFQTMLYCSMFKAMERIDATPMLYICNQMASPDYSPYLEMKKEVITHITLEYETEFNDRLESLITTILDESVPFIQCEDTDKCQWCDYSTICKR